MDGQREYSSSGVKSFFFLPLFLFLSLNLLFRQFSDPNFHGDGADIYVFNQELAWGYSEQPPLFSWLYWIWTRFLPNSLFSLGLFRSALLAGIVYLLYRISQRVLQNQTLALFASFSILFFPTFLRKANFMTHSLLLSLLCVSMFAVFLQIIEKGQWRHYLWGGVLAGAGILSKYNFVMCLVGLLGAGLTIKEVRQRLLQWRLVVAMLIAGLIVLPHGIWFWKHQAYISDIYNIKFMPGESSLPFQGVIPGGVLEFLKTILLLGGPILVVLYFIFRKEPFHQESSSINPIYPKLLGRYLLMICGGMLLSVFITNSRRFPEQWMEPFILLWPLYLFCHLAKREYSLKGLRTYRRVLLSLAVILTVYRAASVWNHYRDHGQNARFLSYNQPAQELQTLLTSRSMIIGQDPCLTANLSTHLSNLSCYASTHKCLPSALARQVDKFILLWNPDFGEKIPSEILHRIQEQLKVTWKTEQEMSYVEVPPLVSGGKMEPLRLGFLVAYPDDSSAQ